MADIGNLNIKLTATAASFTGVMSSARKTMSAFGDASTSLANKVEAVTGRMTNMLGALGGISLGGAVGFGVKLAAEAEQAEVAFSTMLGSVEAARQTLDDLNAFAASTPFQIDGITAAARSLLAFGSSAETVVDELRMIGDVSSGIGAPLGDIAEIYGKARVQGRLFMEDINQLTGRGIPIIGELAKQFGVAESEVRELVSSGQVSFANLQQAMRDMTSQGGRFAGMMEAQSKTLSGVWSTLKDNVSLALRDVGQEIVDGLDIKQVVTDVTQGVQEYATSIAETTKRLIAFVSEHRDLIVTVAKVTAVAGGVLIVGAKVITMVNGIRVAVVGLNQAMWLLVAHPAVAAIAAVGAAAAGTAYALKNYTSVIAELKDAQASLASENDRLRASTLSIVQQLEAYSQKTGAGTVETANAIDLVEKLEKQYGDLGIEVDATTGSIRGLAEGLAEANRQMRLKALGDVANQIREVETNLSLLKVERDSIADSHWDDVADFWGMRDIAAESEENRVKTEVQLRKWKDLQKRMRELQSGSPSADAITGGVPVEPAGASAGLTQAADNAKKLGESAEGANKLAEALAEIEEKALRAGLTLRQQDIRDFIQLGADAEDLARVADAFVKIEKAEGLAEAQRLLEDLQAQIDAFGKTEIDLKLNAFGDIAGVDQAMRDRYEGLLKQAGDMKAVGDLIAEVPTAADKVAEQLAALERLRDAGTIGENQYLTALRNLQEDLAVDDSPDRRGAGSAITDNNALAAALSQLESLNSGGSDVDEKQLREEQKHSRLLAEIKQQLARQPQGGSTQIASLSG